MSSIRLLLYFLLLTHSAVAGAQGAGRPIVDVHLHAFGHDAQGPYPSYVCVPFERLPVWDQETGPYGATFANIHQSPDCPNSFVSQPNDEALMLRTIEVLEANNIFAIAGGSLDYTGRWHAASPERIIPALHFRLGPRSTTPEEIEALFKSGRIHALSEVTLQYQG
ncbi:MAG: hypothetical protein ACR2QR_08920, partial [Woeseiaceae bacterium]